MDKNITRPMTEITDLAELGYSPEQAAAMHTLVHQLSTDGPTTLTFGGGRCKDPMVVNALKTFYASRNPRAAD